MAETRIVTLSPSNEADSVTNVSAFEEAFGEYSEARGRGRARRKKRKLERISNKKEVRSARQEAKKERKVGRQEVKEAVKEARIAKRKAAQAARQAKHLAAMNARQEKMLERRQMRLKRKALGDTPEAEMDDQTMIENGAVSQPDIKYTGATDTSATSEQGTEQTSTGGESQYETPKDGQESGAGYQGSEEEWGGGSNKGPTWGDESEVDEGGQASGDEGSSEDQSSEDSGDESDSGFDGVSDEDTDGLIALEDTYNEFNDEGSIRLTPAVKDVASKIEWNKELVARLKEKSANNPRMKNEIAYKIDNRMKRIAELENQLSKYQNFEGDFAGEDESFVEYSDATGKRRASHGEKGKRVREVMAAKKRAMSERKHVSREGVKALAKKFGKYYPPAIAIRKAKETIAKRKAIDHGGDVTPVDMNLNPEFEDQRIEVPADESTMSSATGTGLNGLDLQRDFDAPRARYVELSSNADGDKKSKINWVGIAIGVGVAAVAIWAIRKYKVFGK